MLVSAVSMNSKGSSIPQFTSSRWDAANKAKSLGIEITEEMTKREINSLISNSINTHGGERAARAANKEIKDLKKQAKDMNIYVSDYEEHTADSLRQSIKELQEERAKYESKTFLQKLGIAFDDWCKAKGGSSRPGASGGRSRGF